MNKEDKVLEEPNELLEQCGGDINPRVIAEKIINSERGEKYTHTWSIG